MNDKQFAQATKPLAVDGLMEITSNHQKNMHFAKRNYPVST